MCIQEQASLEHLTPYFAFPARPLEFTFFFFFFFFFLVRCVVIVVDDDGDVVVVGSGGCFTKRNMLVWLRDGSAHTTVRAAKLK